MRHPKIRRPNHSRAERSPKAELRGTRRSASVRISVFGIRICAAALLVLFAGILSISAQSIYTPYAFTNVAGMPEGGPGSEDGVGIAARFGSPGYGPQGI